MANKVPQTIVEKITDPSLKSYVIKVKTPTNNKPFFIPVVDVRDGEEQVAVVKEIIKMSNKQRGSKYMKPSFTGLFGDTYNERGVNKFTGLPKTLTTSEVAKEV